MRRFHRMNAGMAARNQSTSTLKTYAAAIHDICSVFDMHVPGIVGSQKCAIGLQQKIRAQALAKPTRSRMTSTLRIRRRCRGSIAKVSKEMPMESFSVTSQKAWNIWKRSHC